MTIEIISQSISTKKWDLVGIKFAIPGPAADSLPTMLRGPDCLHKTIALKKTPKNISRQEEQTTKSVTGSLRC